MLIDIPFLVIVLAFAVSAEHATAPTGNHINTRLEKIKAKCSISFVLEPSDE